MNIRRRLLLLEKDRPTIPRAVLVCCEEDLQERLQAWREAHENREPDEIILIVAGRQVDIYNEAGADIRLLPERSSSQIADEIRRAGFDPGPLLLEE